MAQESSRWRFIQHRQSGARTWLWQRFGPDGRLEKTSEPHKKYGQAVLDAIQHGFRPGEDVSCIDLLHGTMYFPPGHRPVYEELPELREDGAARSGPSGIQKDPSARNPLD